VLPLTQSFQSVWHLELANAVRVTILELPRVAFTIRQIQNSLTLLFIVLVLAYISHALMLKDTVSRPFVVVPGPTVRTFVWPVVSTLSMEKA
jgi:hypothetical protein